MSDPMTDQERAVTERLAETLNCHPDQILIPVQHRAIALKAYNKGRERERAEQERAFSSTERTQAADLLRHASEEFANHGCNDHPLPNTREHRKLYNDMVAWNGDPDMPKAETHTKTLWFMDWMLMAYLADRLEGKA
jgi:hypothetical protein